TDLFFLNPPEDLRTIWDTHQSDGGIQHQIWCTKHVHRSCVIQRHRNQRRIICGHVKRLCGDGVVGQQSSSCEHCPLRSCGGARSVEQLRQVCFFGSIPWFQCEGIF